MKKLFLLPLLLWFPVKAQALCVVSDLANLRKGPGMQFKVTWTVGKYTPLLRIGKKPGWYRVADQDGKKHWIASSMVSSRFKCLSIKTTKASLRSGPGPDYDLTAYGLADRYTPFKRINTKGDWYHVSDPIGIRLWIHESQIWRPMRISSVSF